MARLVRLPFARPTPAVFAKGLMFVAVIVVHGPASARETPGRGKRRVVDPAAQRTRQLLQQIEWTEGPATADLGAIAELRLSPGFAFTGTEGARTYLDLCQNPAPENLLGVLAPLQSSGWFVVFELRAKGPEDDPKRRPDADGLLRTLRQEEERQNAIRHRRGWAECKNTAWEIPPSIEGSRRDLTWATRSDFLGQQRVNYTARIFGHHDVVDAHLVVVDPKELARVVPTLTNFLTVLEFKDVLREGGTRPGEDDVKTPAPPPTTSTLYPYGYKGPVTITYRPSTAVASSQPPISRGLITGCITGVAGAIGAAFRKKRSSA